MMFDIYDVLCSELDGDLCVVVGESNYTYEIELLEGVSIYIPKTHINGLFFKIGKL